MAKSKLTGSKQWAQNIFQVCARSNILFINTPKMQHYKEKKI